MGKVQKAKIRDLSKRLVGQDIWSNMLWLFMACQPDNIVYSPQKHFRTIDFVEPYQTTIRGLQSDNAIRDARRYKGWALL